MSDSGASGCRYVAANDDDVAAAVRAEAQRLGLDEADIATEGRPVIDRVAPLDEPVWLTAGHTARLIRDELERDETDMALRFLRKSLADFARLDRADDVERYLVAPPSTGDHRWDTLLGSAVGRACRIRGIDRPDWTLVEPLRTWWFPNGDTIRRARTMQLTPIDFACRGIWIDPRALEAA